MDDVKLDDGLLARDEDAFEARMGRSRKSAGGRSGPLGARLTKALKGARVKSSFAPVEGRGFGGDNRQRVVAKLSFKRHGFGGAGGGGSGGGLAAHAAYLGRDGAAREGEKGVFYDRELDAAEDAHERVRDWALDDSRHFRLMLAPESGARIVELDGDLKDYTRSVMDRIERDLGVELDWVAVDHHNTDNPHVHVIIRGVRRDGVELVLPREYAAHGLREAARDVATETLGERSIADERLKLEREVRSQSLNRLDRMLEQELNQSREVRLQDLGRGRSAELAAALKGRARELERIGLAREARRNVLKLEQDWLKRLEAARALDIRRELAQGRLYERSMGPVIGDVLEVGLRGDTRDRALIVIDSDKGRLLLNTSAREVEGLERGAIVRLVPEGRSAEVERVSGYTLKAQIRVRAETLLDRELERRARGLKASLPQTKGVQAALEARKRMLEREGLGLASESGKFTFRGGAREALRQAELDRTGVAQARERGGQYLDLAHDSSEAKGVWRVAEIKELHQGRFAVLERGRDIAMARAPQGLEAGMSVEIAVKSKTLELSLARGLDLGR